MNDPARNALIQSYRELQQFCCGIVPHRISGPGFEPTRRDLREVQNEVVAFARLVDRVVHAYGEYFEDNGMLGEREVRYYFTDILTTALDGDGLFFVERRTLDRIESLEARE